jgi:carboxymethylenebutenolidase
MRGEIYCGFAENDQYAPLPMVAEWNELMTSSPAKYRYEIHKGAEHGYALPDRDLFQKAGAERDWELIFPMYRRQLAS